MNDQPPYLSRKELRRREAAAAAASGDASVEPSSRVLPQAPSRAQQVVLPSTPATSSASPIGQSVSLPMPTSPQSTSAQALPKVDSAPRADGSPQGAGMAAPRSTGPDTSVRASNTTRARMARAIDRTTATNPSGRKRKRRSGPKVNTSTLARGRKLAPLLAMIFVGGLAVVTALPANAEFQNSSSVVAITNSHDLVVDASQTPKFLPGQSLEASSGALAASRDGVSATTLRTSFGGYTSASYVNNPNGTIQWPFSVTVPISDLFGWRIPPCNWCSADHKGVDFDAGEGYPIQIVADGVVTKVHPYDDNGDGMYVIITHDVNGLKFDSMYCHLLPGTIMVAEGQAVKVTQIVAQVGDTGASTGAHLHFEIHVNGAAIDPFAWLTEHAN